MAFDRPIEADRVDDLGLLSSFLRAPVVGTILWLLGGEHAQQLEEEENLRREENEKLEKDLLGDDTDGRYGGCDGDDADGDGNWGQVSSNRLKGGTVDESEVGYMHIDRGKEAGSTDGRDEKAALSSTTQVVDGDNKENEGNESSMEPWPKVGILDSDDDEDCSEGSGKDVKNNSGSLSQATQALSKSSLGKNQVTTHLDRPATKIVDELVAVMEMDAIPPTSASSNSNDSNDTGNSCKYDKPRFSSSTQGSSSTAVTSMRRHPGISPSLSSSFNSLPPSHSASSFKNLQNPNSQKRLASHSSLNNITNMHNINNSGIRTKKTSWSDECGHRSLVEYFDETQSSSSFQLGMNSRMKQGHWSTRRRRNSEDYSSSGKNVGNVVSARPSRNNTRVIKSALRRSGSYSPPVTLHASSTSTASSSSCSTSTSHPEMKSFRSISVIGSSSSSDSFNSSSNPLNEDISSEMQCVPSTLQSGSGKDSGGLIIPRGGPTGIGGFGNYQLILGSGMARVGGPPGICGHGHNGHVGHGGQARATDGSPAGSPGAPINGRTTKGSPGHSHYLPHPGNGHVSPQWGWYVNFTPPTPEIFVSRPSGDKPPLPDGANVGNGTNGGHASHAVANANIHHSMHPFYSAVQRPYQQFQLQQPYQPSPIPEGKTCTPHTPNVPNTPSLDESGTSPTPSVNQCVPREDAKSEEMQRSLKPTFNKNRKGMGMVLAGNPHHVWPTVPFG